MALIHNVSFNQETRVLSLSDRAGNVISSCETSENGKPSSLYRRFAYVFDKEGLCGAEKLLEQLKAGTLTLPRETVHLNTERIRKNEPKDPKRNHILSGMFTEEEYTELLHHSAELRCSLHSLVRSIVGEWIASVDE